MSIEVRAVQAADADPLSRFFEAVPPEDRTFFKEDFGDAAAVARRWLDDHRALRCVAIDTDADGDVVAFAALSPGVERMSHVADLRLVIAASARRRGLGRDMARRMLLEAIRHDFSKVTVDIAAENTGAIRMFQEIGFQPEALLRDQLRDPTGQLHDLVVLAHLAEERWADMDTAGIGEAVG